MASISKKPQNRGNQPVRQQPVSQQPISQELIISLRKIVRPLVRSRADADDIVQNVLLKIHQKGGEVDPAKFLSWVYQVGRTTAIDFYRKNKSSVAFEDERHSHEFEREDQEQEAAMSALGRCVRPLLRNLKEDDRRMLVDADLNGVPQVQIAEREGLKYSAVKSRVQRARNKLKGEILECCRVEVDSRMRPIETSPKKKGSCC